MIDRLGDGLEQTVRNDARRSQVRVDHGKVEHRLSAHEKLTLQGFERAQEIRSQGSPVVGSFGTRRAGGL
jgi:hypothetical protein